MHICKKKNAIVTNREGQVKMARIYNLKYNSLQATFQLLMDPLVNYFRQSSSFKSVKTEASRKSVYSQISSGYTFLSKKKHTHSNQFLPNLFSGSSIIIQHRKSHTLPVTHHTDSAKNYKHKTKYWGSHYK